MFVSPVKVKKKMYEKWLCMFRYSGKDRNKCHACNLGYTNLSWICLYEENQSYTFCDKFISFVISLVTMIFSTFNSAAGFQEWTVRPSAVLVDLVFMPT